MPDPKDPDEIDPPNIATLCQQIAKLHRYHENCVTFYASGPAADEKKKARHEEFLKTLVAVQNRVCKKQKVAPVETPLLQQVIFFASEIGLPETEARKFFFHFEACGWNMGMRKKVKNWEARLRLWHEEWKNRQHGPGGKSQTEFPNGF